MLLKKNKLVPFLNKNSPDRCNDWGSFLLYIFLSSAKRKPENIPSYVGILNLLARRIENFKGYSSSFLNLEISMAVIFAMFTITSTAFCMLSTGTYSYLP